MNIQFKGTNYELTSDMTDLATRKIQGLQKYVGKIGAEPAAYVDLGKHSEAHQNGAIWYADCNLDVEGKRYYAKAEAETLRNAIDKMVGELAKELRGAKQKHETMIRKGGGRVKAFFRDFRNA
jgi:ribosomal subunit interface protein